jgi:hypothetical protein
MVAGCHAHPVTLPTLAAADDPTMKIFCKLSLHRWRRKQTHRRGAVAMTCRTCGMKKVRFSGKRNDIGLLREAQPDPR